MRPDCRPKCFRPLLLEYGDHRRRDVINGTRSIDRDDGTRLGVTSLPREIRESLECRRDTVMKIVVSGFDPIPRPATIGPRERRGNRQLEKYRKIGHEPASRKPVCRSDLGIGEPATSDLVCVRGQEEAIRDDDPAVGERRPHILLDQFRARRHEKQRLGPRRQLGPWLEQKAADCVANGRSARLPYAEKSDPSRGKRLAKAADLSRLSDPFRAFEYDQLTATRRHPSVMIELVAPFRMPSVIQLFTCSIVLSKFSCAAIARW